MSRTINKTDTKIQNKQLYSFDIFDTLVTRKVATPLGIFAIMQNVLQHNNFNVDNRLKDNFYDIRIGAEQTARSRKCYYENHREIYFDDIYEVIKDNYDLSDDIINNLKKLEIETEIQNIIPITPKLNELKELLKKDKRVILISDMYFSEKDLRLILSHVDPIFNSIPIYVSSEYSASKADGRLYHIIEEKENIRDKSYWIHIGDNVHADIAMAKQYGICVDRVINEPLMPYERFLLYKNPSDIKSQLAIGTSRVVRFNKAHKNQEKYEFGASFAGPVLYSYVDYVLEKSIKNGYKTLYFVSRDGYIPKLIADIIIDKRKLNIKTKYLYGSRRVWRLATKETYDSLIDVIKFEFPSMHDINFLALKLNVDPNELINRLGIKNLHKKFKTKTRIKVFDKLKKDINLKNWIIEQNNKHRDLLLKYLNQEIDFKEKDFAFVDINGSGRSQEYLAEILQPYFNDNIIFFYYTSAISKTPDVLTTKYAFQLTLNNKLIYELLTRNTEGQTIGFIEEDGIIKPLKEFEVNSQILEWGFNDYLEGILDYAKMTNYVSKSYKEYLSYIWERRDKNLAKILGSLVLDNTGINEKQHNIVAPQYHSIQLFWNFILGKKIRYEENLFNRLSLIQSSKRAIKMKKFTDKYVTLQKLLFNLYIHKEEKQAYLRLLGIKFSFARLIWGKS